MSQRNMTDTRRRCDDSTVDAETFVSVKNLLREFGEKAVTATNDDDDDDGTFVSVRQRLRKFDARQDDDGDCDDDNNDDDTYTKVSDRCKEIQHNNRSSVPSIRDYIGSVTTPGKSSSAVFSPIASSPLTTPISSAANRTTPRRKFIPRSSPSTKSLLLNHSSATNVTDLKSFVHPLTVAFHSEADNDQSSSSLKENSADTEVIKYGDVLLKRVEKPVEDRWKRNTANGSSTEAADTQPITKSERSTQQQDTDQQSLPQCSSHKRTVPIKKPRPLDHRSKSLPIFAGIKQDLSSHSVHEETYQNDIGAALKKVGLPVEGRWKYMKNSDEDVSDTSKPLFATMKLRSVGTPTNPTTPKAAASPFTEKLTPSNLKQNFEVDNDDKKSTLAKQRRMPPTSVSDLAKSFSTRVKLASRGERVEEEKVTGRVSSEVNQITQIRSSLKSTAKELEDLRKSLNSSTPVSKLIAERNKAAKANRSEEQTRKKMGAPEVVSARAKNHRRTKSMSSSHPANSHRRRQSMSSTHTAENSTTDGRSSVRMPPSPSCKRSRDGNPLRGESEITLEGDCAAGFLNSWEDFKANSNTIESGGEIWNMNLDDSPFFGGMSSSKSCTALDKYDDEMSGTNDELLPSNSTISEYTTDSSEGDFYYGHRRFIQITLSSGGITEKFEPAVAMSPTEESSVSDGTSMAYPTDSSVDPMSDSRRDRRMVKGAKKFFFGKNKKKSGPIEV
jgi:hypothetical protein